MSFLRTQPSVLYLDAKDQIGDLLTYREKFIAEMERTNIKSKKIIYGLDRDCPDGLTWSVIDRWNYKKPDGLWEILACKRSYYDAVMKSLRIQPDAFYLDQKDQPNDKLTRREILIAEMERTDLYFRKIVERFGAD